MLRNTLMAGVMLAALSTHGYAWTAKTGGSGPQAIGQDGGSATAQQQHQTANARSAARATSSSRSAGGAATGGNARGGTSNVSINGGGGSNGSSGGAGVFLNIPDGRGEAPCGGGVGLGGSGSSAGGGVGGTLWEFGDCKRMRESAALERLGYPAQALAELCQIDRVREAFGGTCPSPVKPHLALDTDADKYDYCFTRSAGDVNQHRECDRIRREN